MDSNSGNQLKILLSWTKKLLESNPVESNLWCQNPSKSFCRRNILLLFPLTILNHVPIQITQYEPCYWYTDFKCLLNNLIDLPGILIILHGNSDRSPYILIIINGNVLGIDQILPTLGSRGPQWGPVELICLSVCLSVSPSLCIYVFLSVHPRQFLEIICAAHTCAQCIRPQAIGSNPLIVSIIFPYVCPYVHPWAFCGFCMYIKFQCGGPALRCIYSHNGVRRTPVGSSPIYMYVSLSGRTRIFLAIICTARNCIHHMRTQDTGSNPLGGSIIYQSVFMIVRGNFAIFVFVLISSMGVQRCNVFIIILTMDSLSDSIMCQFVYPYGRPRDF